MESQKEKDHDTLAKWNFNFIPELKDMYLSHSINTKYFYNYSDNNDIIYRNRIFHAHNLSNCCVREINNKIYSIAYIHAVYPPTLLENLPDQHKCDN
jgi:hypothetical protein